MATPSRTHKEAGRLSHPEAREPQGWGALVIGTLLGLAAGVVAGLWFAPESGAELRSQARERIDGPSVDRLMAEAKADARRYRESHAE